LLVIATNEVLDAVLERVSDTVRRLELPLDTPLVPARVLRFETKPVLAGRPSSLRSEVKYDGGYEFRHQDGIVYELRTPHSRREQVSQETGSNQGRVKGESFKEGMELAGPILRRALRRLDYRDVSVIGDNPMVMRWFDWIDPSPEHWFLAWRTGMCRRTQFMERWMPSADPSNGSASRPICSMCRTRSAP
jgi:hypothetical protein